MFKKKKTVFIIKEHVTQYNDVVRYATCDEGSQEDTASY